MEWRRSRNGIDTSDWFTLIFVDITAVSDLHHMDN